MLLFIEDVLAVNEELKLVLVRDEIVFQCIPQTFYFINIDICKSTCLFVIATNLREYLLEFHKLLAVLHHDCLQLEHLLMQLVTFTLFFLWFLDRFRDFNLRVKFFFNMSLLRDTVI